MNPYTILGVADNSPLDECKKAYKRLAIKYHPDSGGDITKFQEINKAWEMIQKGGVSITPLRKVKPHVRHKTLFTYTTS